MFRTLVALTFTALLPVPVVAAIQSYPAEFRTTTIQTNGTSLYVRYGGKGPAVVLLHGFGDTGDMWAPLAAAAAAGSESVTKFLIDKGAEVDARNARGDTALLLAASGGHAGVVAALMAARADKDAQNEFGDTALIIASRNGDAKTVRLLLDGGVSTKLRNQDRATAADIAAARDFGQVLALLRQ